MKISSSSRNINNTKNAQSFKGLPENPKCIPAPIGKLGKIVGEYVNTPEQKLFLATSALMFQPLVDLKFADDEKKTDSAIKSASKAIAGGLTGVAIRAGFLKLIDTYIGFDKNNKLNEYFLPKAARKLRKNSPSLADVRLKQYCQTLGTLFAVLFMIFFSNSKLDVPLTSDFQDLLSGVIKEDKSWIKSLGDVGKARKDKINSWFNHKKDIITNIKNKIQNVVSKNKEAKPNEENSK